MHLSVVIPTYNRREKLNHVFAGLSRQTHGADDFEVVIVDDGSVDGTAEAIQASSYPFDVRVLRQKNGGPARARNRGVEEARGELVLFLDDDVEPSSNLIDQHLRSHAAETEDVVVIGPLTSLPSYRDPWVAWEQARIEQQYDAMVRGILVPTFRQFWTGNASVARRHLIDAGGFNPEFLRGEDVELGARLHKRGLKFRFNPRAAGLHHAERSLESWSLAHKSYGRLEVQIFGQLGEKDMLEVLAGNFSRLHVGTRWVLRSCFARPMLYHATAGLLRSWLSTAAARQAPSVSDKACSVLANVLYWHESAEALGTKRLETLLRRAQEIVNEGVVEFGSIPE